MKHLFRFSETAFAASIFVAALQNSPTHTVNAQYFKSVEEAHNPGEEHRYFDIMMKPYPIPAETTTYVDFVFNLPDDLPDLFHVTYGEVINSQPEHLHHFALSGCPEKIDPEKENLPVESFDFSLDCLVSVGGWAPGADVFGNTDLDEGILLGRALGVQSLRLNVHYTDGVYVGDESQKILKMATDGIRVHYTPVFRPYSSINKPLINVATAPTKLSVPPGESRFFLSRTCTVDTSCKDANPGTIRFLMSLMETGDMGMEVTCESVQSLCNIGGETGSYIQRLCPKTCGLCELGPDGEENPFDPDTYRATAVSYHAHLLGREMYTTLIRGAEAASPATNTIEESSTVVLPKSAPLTQDLGSREFWIFDNQETIPLDYDVVRDDTILRGTEIRAGDKLQSTCVFDSTYNTDPTYFYLSTYDEMCINSIRVTFETPTYLLNGDEDATAAVIDIATQLHLLPFSCSDDEGGDVYSGILTPDEDARDIWKDHPVDQVEGCTYKTSDFFFSVLTEETRNCREGDMAPNLICGEGLPLTIEANAGATCEGGSLDVKDANAGVTEEDCVAAGGSYSTYTCGQANDWLILEATLDPATADGSHYGWWKSRCCEESASEEEPTIPEEPSVSDSEEEPTIPEEPKGDSEKAPSNIVSSATTGPRSVKIVLPTISAAVVVLAMFWG